MDTLRPHSLEVSLRPVESIPSNDDDVRFRGLGSISSAPSGGPARRVQVIFGAPSSSYSQQHAVRTAGANSHLPSSHRSQTEQANPHHTPLYTTAPLPDRSHLRSQCVRPAPSIHSLHATRTAQSVPSEPSTALQGQPPLPVTASDIARLGSQESLASLIWQTNVVTGDAAETISNAENLHTAAPLTAHALIDHIPAPFPPLATHRAGVGGAGTTTSLVAADSGVFRAVISPLEERCSAAGSFGLVVGGVSSDLTHIVCAGRTDEIALARAPSLPTELTQHANLSSLPTFVTGRQQVQGVQAELGGGVHGGIAHSSTQTSGSGYSKAGDSRPPSVIPTICSNHPNHPINTSDPRPISLRLSQPNRPQRPQHIVTDDNGFGDQTLSILPCSQTTASDAGFNTPLDGSFDHSALKADCERSTYVSTGAPPQIIFMYPDLQAPPFQSDSITRSSVQVATDRVQTIAKVISGANMNSMSLSIDTTANGSTSPPLPSPVPKTPTNATVPGSTMADEGCLVKAEMQMNDSRVIGGSSAMYGPGGTESQSDSLIFQLPRAHPTQSPQLDRARGSHQQHPSLASSSTLCSSQSATYNTQTVHNTSSTGASQYSIYQAHQYVPQAHFQPRSPPAITTPSFSTNSFCQLTPSTPAPQQTHQLPTPSSTDYPFTPESSESSSRHNYYYPSSHQYMQTPSGPYVQPLPTSQGPFSSPYHGQLQTSYSTNGGLVHRQSYGPSGYSGPQWYAQIGGNTTPTGHPLYQQMHRPAEPILAPGEEPAQRPAACYAALIAEALFLSPPPHQLLVSEIAEAIKKSHPYYRQNPSKIYNGVRHQTSMCKAFVKLNRPWGDQSGGARKWAIRDGCQNSFQMGSPTWSLPPRFTSNNALKAKQKTQARTVSKSKQLALGHGESPERELSPFDDSNGPSNGAPWDPTKDPHPWRNEPRYKAHLAEEAAKKLKLEQGDSTDEPVTPRSQQTQVMPYHSSASTSTYSVSPHSPFNYNHHAYMQQGFYHPAYSTPTTPYAQHNDYADYGYGATNFADSQRFAPTSGSGFGGGVAMSGNTMTNGTATGQGRYIDSPDSDQYGAYDNSPPLAHVSEYVEESYASNTTTTAVANGGDAYWNSTTGYGYPGGYGRADLAGATTTATVHEVKNEEDSPLSDAPSPDFKVEPA